MKENSKHLDFEVIRRELDTLLVALENKIDREWPAKYATVTGARELFLLTIRVTRNTYETIRYFCADKPKDVSRKLAYAASAPPLSRTIVDSLFTVIFILEDMPTRCSWYHKAGWAETNLEHRRYESEYGNLPSWKPWLDEYKKFVDSGKSVFGITAAEEQDASVIPRWPNPGQMPNHGVPGGAPLPPARQFLRYLNDWYYRDLSQQAHLSGHGLLKRAGFLMADFVKQEGIEQRLTKFKSDQVFTTIILVLALVSEVESYFRFGLADRVKYLWGILNAYSDMAKELYDARYSQLLSYA